MTADVLLSRLEGVQTSGNGWRARCPCCGGTSRKLSVTEGAGGRVLMTCFSCHDTPGILAAVGLEVADLFPARMKPCTPAEREAARSAAKQGAWGAALGVLAYESTVLEVAAAAILHGESLNDEDGSRVRIASQRIHDARAVLL